MGSRRNRVRGIRAEMTGLRLAFSILALCGLFTPIVSEAQQVAAKAARIGWLGDSSIGAVYLREDFLQGLRDLGYVEARDFVLERRYAEGEDRAVSRSCGRAGSPQGRCHRGREHTCRPGRQGSDQTTPIVFPAVSDPVASGLVTGLARPGGNVTGLSFFAPELVGKCMELLKEAVPRISRVAVLWQPTFMAEQQAKDMLKSAETAAARLGVQLQIVEARTLRDLERAFADMARARVDALTVLTSPALFTDRQHLVAVAAKSRLPTVYPWRDAVESGGLMSYGPNVRDLFRRAATYVDKILKGTKPSELPVEQPTKFELVINLKAAKALGLTIPASVLARADRVVER